MSHPKPKTAVSQHIITDSVGLILCVNLAKLKDAQIASKTLFLSVSVWVSQDEFSIWMSRLSKEVCPHQCTWAPNNPLRAWIEQNSRRRANLPPAKSWDIHLFLLYICAPGSQTFRLALGLTQSASSSWTFRLGLGLISLAPMILRPLGLNWHYSTGFPGLPACGQHIMGLLSLLNCTSQSLIINLFQYIPIYSIGCFAGERWLIHRPS